MLLKHYVGRWKLIWSTFFIKFLITFNKLEIIRYSGIFYNVGLYSILYFLHRMRSWSISTDPRWFLIRLWWSQHKMQGNSVYNLTYQGRLLLAGPHEPRYFKEVFTSVSHPFQPGLREAIMSLLHIKYFNNIILVCDREFKFHTGIIDP